MARQFRGGGIPRQEFDCVRSYALVAAKAPAGAASRSGETAALQGAARIERRARARLGR